MPKDDTNNMNRMDSAASATETNAEGGVRSDMDSIREDLTQLRSDMSSLAQNLLHAGKSTGGQARERITSAVQSRIGHLNESLGGVTDPLKNTMDQVQTYVEQKPMIAVGTAFGVGLLLGSLMSRK